MNLEKEVFEININDIMPNRFQPREIFDEQALNELSLSIKEHGVIQPIIVRKIGDKYEIIAGERRFRASQLAGKQTIPALIRDIDDKEAAKIALLENLQRSDLTPIEEAKTYQTILKLDNITQEELAANLGKSQSTVANKLRLLNLAEEVQTALLNKQISERHARSLLNVPNLEEQKKLLNQVIINRLTVRQLDEEIMSLTGKKPVEEPKEEIKQPEVSPTTNLENKEMDSLQQVTPVTIPTPNEQTVPTMEPNQPTPPEEVQTAPKNIFDMLREQSLQPENKISPEEPQPIPVPSNPTISNENVNQQAPISIPVINTTTPENTNQPTTPVVNTVGIQNEQVSSIPTINQQETTNSPQPISENIETQPKQEENNYNQVYDLRFAINNVRQAVQNTEKFGFNIDVQEFDLDNVYQIIIKIDKNKY